MQGQQTVQGSLTSSDDSLAIETRVQDFCRCLPKVELHAHLNGSVRSSTIRDLARTQSLTGISDDELQRLTSTGPHSLADCFKLFDAVHQLTTHHEAITRITQEVIEDFAEENVIYLELRTTPKNRPEHGITKQSYMAAVLAGYEAFKQQHALVLAKKMAVKFILSIDRRNNTADAMETVNLALHLRPQGIVGMDLSGNPALGSWDTWLPAIQHARQSGLKITLHAAEVFNPAETHAMLDFQPDRLCHMCMLDEQLQQRLWTSKIPVELCLTSNVKTHSVQGYVDHHFKQFYAANHPVVLCTDDSTVFGTSMSQEYAVAAVSFKLSQAQLMELALGAVKCCFCNYQEKQQLRQQILEFQKQQEQQMPPAASQHGCY